ncbi:lactosylceramide 4-alpha-galactosyltransferase-like [Centruroides vittatus]|uniref:lactosylceramide 4-alpha-galactosyltransferase-like n=1 Tax=Centruroides vittatus TaxID=120091 RepID=UPI00350FD789
MVLIIRERFAILNILPSNLLHVNKKRKLSILLLISFVILILLILKIYILDEYPAFYYDNTVNLKAHHTFYHTITSRDNIFFVETSGASTLNNRQACAIESTARHNPLFSVKLLMFTPNELNDNFNLTRQFSNIEITGTSLENVLEGTPLLEWYNQGKWKKSKFKIIHFSDAARYALLWKFGGIYFDLDIVMLRPFPPLKNFVIKETEDRIANGIFGMQYYHPITYNCMRAFARIYKSHCFVCGGPPLFTHVFLSFCAGKNVNAVQKKNDCGVTVLNQFAAFPVFFNDWEDYFSKSSAKDVLRKINDSYLIHVWGKFNRNKKLHPGSGSAYEEVMAKNCPHVYAQAIRNGTL